MDYLKPGMVRTIYERIKQLMYQKRSSMLNRWMTVEVLVQDGFDRNEVEECISLLYYPASLFYSPHVDKIALVR